jgi:hypothetical protein
MTGWPLAAACRLACRLGELSQHSVVPHCWQVRKCTHRAFVFMHSSHSCRSANRTLGIAAMCEQDCEDVIACLLLLKHLVNEGNRN